MSDTILKTPAKVVRKPLQKKVAARAQATNDVLRRVSAQSTNDANKEPFRKK